MFIITLAHKYYALWEMYTRTNNTSYGYTEVRNYYRFVKNLGKDLEKAKANYPDVEINLKINRFHRTEEVYEKRVWTSVDYIRFGKYFRTPVRECYDFSWLEWYYDRIENDTKHKDFVEEWLLENGYKLNKMGSYYYLTSPLEQKRSMMISDKYKDILEKVNNNESINFSFEKNLDYKGEYFDGSSEIRYHFNHYNTYSYEGYPYGLPLLNGKAKRIKFKNLVLTSYTTEMVNDELVINIEDFRIIK